MDLCPHLFKASVSFSALILASSAWPAAVTLSGSDAKIAQALQHGEALNRQHFKMHDPVEVPVRNRHQTAVFATSALGMPNGFRDQAVPWAQVIPLNGNAIRKAADLVCNDALVPLAHKCHQLSDGLVEFLAHGFSMLLVFVLHHAPHLRSTY